MCLKGVRCMWGGGGRRARVGMVGKYQRKFFWRLLSASSCSWSQEEVFKDCVASDFVTVLTNSHSLVFTPDVLCVTLL